jgi:hypothetical protein
MSATAVLDKPAPQIATPQLTSHQLEQFQNLKDAIAKSESQASTACLAGLRPRDLATNIQTARGSFKKASQIAKDLIESSNMPSMAKDDLTKVLDIPQDCNSGPVMSDQGKELHGRDKKIKLGLDDHIASTDALAHMGKIDEQFPITAQPGASITLNQLIKKQLGAAIVVGFTHKQVHNGSDFISDSSSVVPKFFSRPFNRVLNKAGVNPHPTAEQSFTGVMNDVHANIKELPTETKEILEGALGQAYAKNASEVEAKHIRSTQSSVVTSAKDRLS